MANLTLLQQWDQFINEIATTDPLLGGPGGPLNVAVTQLGNRTEWLRAQVDALQAAGYAVPADITAALTAHEAAADPHPQYTTAAELNAAIAQQAAPVTSVAGKTGAVVLTPADVGAASSADVSAAMAAHEKAADPHPQYTTAPGLVLPFAGATPPAGWLECNGAAISRTSYAALFAAIGTTYGVGNGTTTFNLPDLRGEFVRGWDHGRGVDAGRARGSWQADDFKSHTHSYQHGAGGAAITNAYKYGWTLGNYTTGATGGTETRPRNVAMMYCIRY